MLVSVTSAEIRQAFTENIEPFANECALGTRPRAKEDPPLHLAVSDYVLENEYGRVWEAPFFVPRVGLFNGPCHPKLESFATDGYLSLPFRKAPRCKVQSSQAVVQAIEAMVRIAREVYPQRRVVLRGQCKEYPVRRAVEEAELLFGTGDLVEPSLHPSGARRTPLSPVAAGVWAQLVQSHYGRTMGYDPVQNYQRSGKVWPFAGPNGRAITLAFAQHYGLPTPALDVTTDVDVALWFALNAMHGEGNRTIIHAPDNEYAVIYVIAAEEGQFFDANLTGPSALRPLRQAGGFIASNWGHSKNKAAKCIVGAVYFPTSLRSHMSSALPSAAHLFPGPDEDAFVSSIQSIARKRREHSRALEEIAAHVYWVGDEWNGVRVPARGLVERQSEAEDSDSLRPLGEGEGEDTARVLSQDADLGDVEATYRLGWLFMQQGDQRALALLTKAATGGHLNAMNDVGTIYQNRNDRATAEYWYQKAADAGLVLGAYNLGTLLVRTGRRREAEPWLELAALGGDADAACSLGKLLLQRNELDKAAHWLQQAAEAGQAQGAFNLGTLYKVRKRFASARRWFRRAHDLGDVDAADELRRLKDK